MIKRIRHVEVAKTGVVWPTAVVSRIVKLDEINALTTLWVR